MMVSQLPDYSDGNPYRELYIYYLSGRVPPVVNRELADFIGNWEEDGFSFLFFSKPASNQMKRLLGRYPQLTLLDDFHMRYEEWQGVTVGALRVGRFHIRPPWVDGGADADDASGGLSIMLDPGVVFGTGTHATTGDCLEAVAVATERAACESVLDLGSGTGLLGLAAVRCGSKRCLAVDLNALATETARINVRLNRLEDRILVVQGRAENFIDTPADLLIANIHYAVMRQLISAPGFLEKRLFILSGLMRSEAMAVRDYLRTVPVRLLREWSGDGIWHTFLGEVRDRVVDGRKGLDR